MPIISSNSHFRTTKIVLFVSVISAVAVIELSLNTWSSFRSNVSDLIQSFEIVNVFPHDPNAFTQENIFEWHFAIRGPTDTEFEGGIYHGRIQLPSEY